MRPIPTHRRSGCAAICAIPRETSRYMTQNPRNESNSAPSRLLMAHETSHFAPKSRERTRANDERTQRIDVRTRQDCKRTRVSQRNPSRQDDAGGTILHIAANGLSACNQAAFEPARVAVGRTGGEWPNDPGGRFDANRFIGYYSYISRLALRRVAVAARRARQACRQGRGRGSRLRRIACRGRPAPRG